MTPEDLVELRRIEALKYRYVRFLDLKRWDDVEALFTEDAMASYGGGAWAFEGRAAIMEFLRGSMGSTSMLTSHKVHQPEISLAEGRDAAAATWALDDVVIHGDYGLTSAAQRSTRTGTCNVTASGSSPTPATSASTRRCTREPASTAWSSPPSTGQHQAAPDWAEVSNGSS